MASEYSFSDLAASAGSVSGDFLKDVANSVANGYCSLYKNYPGFLTGVSGDPLTPFRRGLANSLCSGQLPGLPSSPSVLFSGGQCAGADYLVRTAGRARQLPNFDPVDFTANFRVYGPVRGLRVGSTDQDRATVYCVASDPTGQQTVENVFSYGSSLYYEVLSCSVVSIERMDAGSDSCGDPPPDYPATRPTAPELGPRIPLPPTPGGIGLTIPVIYAPITGNVNVTVNVNATVPIDIVFDLRGASVRFGKDGAGGNSGFTSDDRATLIQTGVDASASRYNSQTAASNAAAANSNASDASAKAGQAKDASIAARDSAIAAKTAADSAKKNTDPKPAPTSPTVNKNIRPSSEKGRDGVASLLYVEVVLTSLPIERKRQYGDGAPNVYYAGWFEWIVDGKTLPREPISFQASLFSCPKEASGYAYTLTNGAKGYCIEYTDMEM